MAQRISRAKRNLRGRSFRELGDLAVVLRVLSLIYHAGHGRRARPGPRSHPAHPPAHLGHPRARGARPARVDAAPARPAPGAHRRRRAAASRSTSRTAPCGTPPRSPRASPSCRARSPRSAAGRYQILAAIAALHADARTSAETDWPQILAWYDDLVALSDDPERDDPAAVLNRAVAVGHVDGARAGLDETERVRAALGDRDQWHAVRAYLHELGGELEAAADEYAAAAERATERTERDHFIRRAARAVPERPAPTGPNGACGPRRCRRRRGGPAARRAGTTTSVASTWRAARPWLERPTSMSSMLMPASPSTRRHEADHAGAVVVADDQHVAAPAGRRRCGRRPSRCGRSPRSPTSVPPMACPPPRMVIRLT